MPHYRHITDTTHSAARSPLVGIKNPTQIPNMIKNKLIMTDAEH